MNGQDEVKSLQKFSLWLCPQWLQLCDGRFTAESSCWNIRPTSKLLCLFSCRRKSRGWTVDTDERSRPKSPMGITSVILNSRCEALQGRTIPFTIYIWLRMKLSKKKKKRVNKRNRSDHPAGVNLFCNFLLSLESKISIMTIQLFIYTTFEFLCLIMNISEELNNKYLTLILLVQYH